MRGKILRGKIRTYLQLSCGSQLRFSVKKMEPNFVKIKVPELKNYLQVRGISVARELAIEIIKEQRDQISISVKLVTDDGTILTPIRSSRTGLDPLVSV